MRATCSPQKSFMYHCYISSIGIFINLPTIVCHEWDNRYDARHIAFVERSYEEPSFASAVTAQAPESLELDSLITTV